MEIFKPVKTLVVGMLIPVVAAGLGWGTVKVVKAVRNRKPAEAAPAQQAA